MCENMQQLIHTLRYFNVQNVGSTMYVELLIVNCIVRKLKAHNRVKVKLLCLIAEMMEFE